MDLLATVEAGICVAHVVREDIDDVRLLGWAVVRMAKRQRREPQEGAEESDGMDSLHGG